MNRNWSRVIACVSFGLALAVSCMVAQFIALQSPSMLRNLLFLHSAALIPWLPVGVLGGAAFWLLSRQHHRYLLPASLACLALALVAWYAVQLPSVSAWLLPPPTVK